MESSPEVARTHGESVSQARTPAGLIAEHLFLSFVKGSSSALSSSRSSSRPHRQSPNPFGDGLKLFPETNLLNRAWQAIVSAPGHSTSTRVANARLLSRVVWLCKYRTVMACLSRDALSARN